MTQSTPDTKIVKQAADEEDVERINSFFNSKPIKQELHRFTYSTTLDRAYERDDRRLFYVEEDGEVIGALMVWCESRVLDTDEAQIRLVAVAKEKRNQGVARRLCAKAETFAAEYGEYRISADVASTSTALDFWKACDYEVSYVWKTDNGREMSRMGKEL
jgi:GNAT superfamily N-acetyltransferase